MREVVGPVAVRSVADGRTLTSGSGPRARVWDEAVERAWREGLPTVTVELWTPDGPRRMDFWVHALEPVAWWIFAGSLLFAGARAKFMAAHQFQLPIDSGL